MKSEKATAIVCAFNEEHTIGRVIETLLQSPIIDEIIVINDGSFDSTSAVLKTFKEIPRVRAVESAENRGKGFAMAEGIIHACNDILVFVDADLLNLEARYIDELVQPLLLGLTDMVIGPPTENTLDEKLNPFKPLSGERALFKKDILPLVEKIRISRFGVETLINLYYRSKKKRVLYVPLRGLIHPMKLQKHSFDRATREYSTAVFQIVKTVVKNYSLLLLVVQNIFRR